LPKKVDIENSFLSKVYLPVIKKMKLSVVIPVMNKLHYTKQCLSDLTQQTCKELEIIIIDNASTDGTKNYLENIKGIKVLTNKENKGCAASWNQGVKESTGEWVIILNNDVRIPRNCFDLLISSAISMKIDVISPGMREGELNYNHAEYALSYTKKMKDVFRRCTPSGVCFALKKDLFGKIGLFDENFYIGQYEDADFFRRCKLLKLTMGITGKSFIHHFGSTTQKQIKENSSENYSLKNREYHRKKWKIGFFKRHIERYRDQLMTLFWSKKEYYRHGHSILEKFDGISINYH
jgi:GT2 family glycosyltransferase